MTESSIAIATDIIAAPISVDDVDVALGFDSGYAPHAATVIASAVRHAPGARFRFLMLHTGIEPELRTRVEASAPGATFIWREINDADLPAMAQREHFSRAILFRLGIEKHAPADWRRVLYLDADLVVEADLRPLWSADLKGAPVGAVLDCFVDPLAFARRWKLADAAAAYFNSGVLLIDLERVRAENLFTQAIAFAAAHIDEIYLADQDALNVVCWGRWARLDTRWNVQRHMTIPSLIAQIDAQRHLVGAPAIIHFTGPEKPWLAEGYHPWAWTYWRNIARTPFAEDVAKRYRVSRMRRLLLWLRWLRRRR